MIRDLSKSGTFYLLIFANRNGYVYPKETTFIIRFRNINETVGPPLLKTVALMKNILGTTALIFKAPRLYTQEEKTRRGGYYL